MIAVVLGIGTVLGVIVLMIMRVLGSAAARVLADEFKSSAPTAAVRIAHRASQRLPEPHRADYLETWLAELEQFGDRPLRALWFAAFNCTLASRGIARELVPALQPAGSAADSAANVGVREGADRAMRRAFGAQRERQSSLNSAGRSAEVCMTIFVLPLIAIFGLLNRLGLDGVQQMYRKVVFEGLEQPVRAGLTERAKRNRNRVGHMMTEGFQFAIGNRYDHSRPWKSVVQLLINCCVVMPFITVTIMALVVLLVRFVSSTGLF